MSVKKIRNIYRPYNFDFKYEYKTYINIGKDHKIEYKADRSRIFKLYKSSIEFVNQNESKYKKFNCFSDWEQYVKEKIDIDYFYDEDNLKNFKKFLNKGKREKENAKSNIGNIVTPIYITTLSGSLTFMCASNVSNQKFVYVWIVFSVFAIIIMMLSLRWSINKNHTYNFYKDYIEIIEKQEKEISEASHQN